MIQHIIPSVNDHEAYIISNESVYKYVSDEFIPNMIESTDIYLNDMCRDAMVASYDSENYIIALTYTNRLVINGSVFTDGVISFTVHNEFLIYVSTRHMIVCVILENVMKDLQAVDCNDSTSIEKLSTEREAAGIGKLILPRIPSAYRVRCYSLDFSCCSQSNRKGGTDNNNIALRIEDRFSVAQR